MDSSARVGGFGRARRAPAASGESAPGLTPAAAPSGAVSIWYRSSEGCPDGEAFVARLAELGRSATLASVGDHVDFVVTFAATPGSSAGHLERQTERGTVAIRELDAPSCEEVAEALALSLELAVQPAATAASPPPPMDASGAASPATPPDSPETLRPSSAPRFHLGARASAATGLSPHVAPGAALFIELSASAGASAPSARLSVHGAYRQSRIDDVRLDVAMLAGRLEGSAFAWGTGAFALHPGLGVDIGVLDASTSTASGRSDQGIWAAGVALLRASLQLLPHLSPEAQVGVRVPFIRYAMGAPTGDDVYRTGTVGVEIALGARWSP